MLLIHVGPGERVFDMVIDGVAEKEFLMCDYLGEHDKMILSARL